MMTNTYMGFTRDELGTAFGTVRNQADWRAPISCVIDADDWEVTQAAVAFFTGTELKITRNQVDSWFSKVKNCMESRFTRYVWAAGYREGPAGP